MIPICPPPGMHATCSIPKRCAPSVPSAHFRLQNSTALLQSSTSYGAAESGDAGGGTFSPAVLAPTSGAAVAAVALDVENEGAVMIPGTAPVSPNVRGGGEKDRRQQASHAHAFFVTANVFLFFVGVARHVTSVRL